MTTTNTIQDSSFDIQKIRANFPILSKMMGASKNQPLVYFDNGATTQKPQVVIDAISNYYEEQNPNVHRGVHTLSQEITVAYEDARATIQKHLNAEHAKEIIFTKGTTDSINLVANGFTVFIAMRDGKGHDGNRFRQFNETGIL